MSGMDLAARNGIIVKSGGAIEQLGEVAVFDETGTLTLGIPKVSTIIVGTRPGSEGHPQGEALQQDLCVDERRYDEDTLLRLAASVEQLSTHILPRAIVEVAQEDELPYYMGLGGIP